jgi:excisionase family DNA binding protein
MDEKDLYNRTELAEKLSVTTRTLHEWVKSERIPQPYKIGRKLLWKRSEIDECLEQSRKKPSQP